MESTALVCLGAGITFPVLIYAIQYLTDTKRIGIVSSLGQFMNNLGGTIGLTILGVIHNRTFTTQLANLEQTMQDPSMKMIVTSLGGPNLVGRVLAAPEPLQGLLETHLELAGLIPYLRDRFALSIPPVFLVAFATSVGALIASLFITGSLREQIAGDIPIRQKADGAQQ